MNIFASRVLKVFSVNNIIGKFKTKEKNPGFLNQTPQYLKFEFNTVFHHLVWFIVVYIVQSSGP